MTENIIILGNGGHSLTLQDSLICAGFSVKNLGIVDYEKGDVTPLGIAQIGSDEDLPSLFQSGWRAAVMGVGFILDTTKRRRLVAMLQEIGFSLMTVIDPSANVSKGAVLGEGTFVAKRAVIQPGAIVEEMCIINTGAIVEHGCCIGAHSHVSSGATLLGDVQVGHDSFIGGGAVVREGVRIGSHCIVGAGSVVVDDLPNNSIAYGNPCRVRRAKI